MWNRLVHQAELAAGSGMPQNARAQVRGWLGLLDEFAHDNRMMRSGEFSLDALARNMMHGGRWGEPYQWPGCDHPTYFKRDRRAVAVVAEPYNIGEVRALEAYARQQGLVLHAPPNIKASLWYPGFTYFVVITRPDFGKVRWLTDQLAFTVGGSVAIVGN
jgi:hypothetical protein